MQQQLAAEQHHSSDANQPSAPLDLFSPFPSHMQLMMGASDGEGGRIEGIIEEEDASSGNGEPYEDAEESRIQAHLNSMEQRLRDTIMASLQQQPPSSYNGAPPPSAPPAAAPNRQSSGTPAVGFGGRHLFQSPVDGNAVNTPDTLMIPPTQAMQTPRTALSAFRRGELGNYCT